MILVSKEISLYFGLDALCLFEDRTADYDMVDTSSAASLFEEERFLVQFVRFQPQIGRKQEAPKNTMTTSLCWSK
jgi:hypothetical protein